MDFTAVQPGNDFAAECGRAVWDFTNCAACGAHWPRIVLQGALLSCYPNSKTCGSFQPGFRTHLIDVLNSSTW